MFKVGDKVRIRTDLHYDMDIRFGCNEDMEVAFSMFPTSLSELMAIADSGRVMPPKSTWFEPKLLSGLFIHKLK